MTRENGPGSYNPTNYNLTSKGKKQTIGVKRDKQKEVAPGPGHYSPEKHSIHKPSAPEVDFKASAGRLSKKPD